MELADRRCQATAQKEEGNAAFRRCDVAKAAACFTRSLELDPTNPAVYANLAAAYLKAGAFQQAESSADSALLLDEGYVKAFHRRAAARTALGKLAEAEADLERVLQSLPGNPQVVEELRNLRLRSDTAARLQKASATKAMPLPWAKTLADFEKASRSLHDNPAALAAYVHAHVFDDTQNRNTDFLEHLQTLARIQQGDVLRCGHNHGTRDRYFLRECQLNIAGARRHIHHQIIQIAPVGQLQQLLQRLRDHGAAPDHGLIRVDHETD